MDLAREGWERFGAADWTGASEAFASALDERPGDPEALDGLGQSLWWLGDRAAAIDRRREAYAAYRRAGADRPAAGLAVYLAGEYRIDGREAEATGWLARARRLLEADEGSTELGWLAIEDAKRATDPVVAERHARAALDLSHALPDPDIECMALAQLGRAVVGQGRVEEGVALLDEAMTVALGGESQDPLACGDACCTTLLVCDSLDDLRRATQWCEAVVEFAERRRFAPVQSWCRGIYAGVLLRGGDWKRAEAVLADALEEGPGRRAALEKRALALATLARLRLYQGRIEEADGLLAGLDGRPEALGPSVELALSRGDLAVARALLERAAAQPGRDPRLLTLQGDLALAEGDHAGATAAADRLVANADALARDDLAADGALVAGRAAAAAGDSSAAERQLEDAVARFTRLGFPHEEARARLALAEVQATLGSPLAPAAARAACTTFERLGARPDADRAAALLRSLGGSGRTRVRGERDRLTPRELEVLALVKDGLSNAEIAERLVIAPKTAEHHVSNLLAKLGVRSRAEAAAHAVREGL